MDHATNQLIINLFLLIIGTMSGWRYRGYYEAHKAKKLGEVTISPK